MSRGKVAALSVCCALLLGVAPASATPFDFYYAYDLNATTDNGMAFTGIFFFDPATNTFRDTQQSWAFQLQHASVGVTTSDVNNTVTFRSPGGIPQIAWPNAAPNYASYGSGANPTYIDILQSAGTGLLGWGSSSVDSEVYLEILGLPLSYSDPAGLLTFSSFSQKTPGQSPFDPYFLDDLNGTVTLAANQQLPATATTPEPASSVLFASGLVLIAGCRRRRNSLRPAS